MNDITPQHSLDEITALERQVADKDDEITRLRAQLERARERLHTISLSARDKATKRMAIDALRELENKGGDSDEA